MRLPKDTTEAWLESQRPSGTETRHSRPPNDVMEAWLQKRAGRSMKRGKDAA